MEESTLISLAQLRSIKATWKETEVVEAARKRLQQANSTRPATAAPKHDFQFIIDDHSTYHKLDDFRSQQAKKLYQKYSLLERSCQQQQKKLERLRNQYAQADKNGKQRMEAGILDLEKRVQQLYMELEETAIQIRQSEKQANK